MQSDHNALAPQGVILLQGAYATSMSNSVLSDAIRAQIQGNTAKQVELPANQRAALRSWARRQKRAKAEGQRITAPSGLLIWL